MSWHMKQTDIHLLSSFSPPFPYSLKKTQSFVLLPTNFQISHILKLVPQPLHRCSVFPILGLHTPHTNYQNSSHNRLQMSLFPSSDLVPCWVYNIQDHRKQTAGVFWGNIARWLHDYSDHSKLSWSHGLIKFCQCICSIFYPWPLFQCLSARMLHKAPYTSQKKCPLAETKSLQCRLLSKNRSWTFTCWIPQRPGHRPPWYWIVSKVLTTPPHCFSDFCFQALGNPT